MKKQLKLFIATCFLNGALMATDYPSVFEKWDSPTPEIHDRFDDFLDYMPHNAVAVEVGVDGGGYSAFILRKTNPEKLYLIDCWAHQDPSVYNDPDANVADHEQEDRYQAVKRRFADDSRVVIIRDYSENAVHQFADESIDWVYIDANHSYEAVKQDLDLWWPKIKNGGMLSGHDYAIRPDFGVVQAVNEFIINHNLSLTYRTVEEHIYDSWAIRKPN